MALSSRDALQRTLDAARSPDWSLGFDHSGVLTATHGSGVDGMPWVVKVRSRGAKMRVWFYAPGDDSDVEGDDIGELNGNPREMGRQLRSILENLELVERGSNPDVPIE